MALIVTLLALALITAMVVEFAYGVYTGTNNLYNWRDSQRLSVMARSGVNVSARLISDWLNTQKYNPGFIEMPIENPFEDFKGTITVRIENEDSKFNINSIVNKIGNKNNDAYESFIRLLEVLRLDKKIADRVKDYIDPDSIAEFSGFEVGAKNSDLNSVDELLLINGISRKDYDTLLPYIAVLEGKDNLIINVNGAAKPVLMIIFDPAKREFPITDDRAEKIIKYRENNPFQDIGSFNNYAGTGLSTNSITTEGTNFSIRSTATSGGVKRIIETVIINMPSSPTVKYWKEY